MKVSSQTQIHHIAIIETGNQQSGPKQSTVDGLPIRGGEEISIVVEM